MTSKNSGLAQLWVLVGLVVMAVALPIASMLVRQNQDNRNKATYNCSEVTNPTNWQQPCAFGWSCNTNTGVWVCVPSGATSVPLLPTSTKVPTAPTITPIPTLLPTYKPSPTPSAKQKPLCPSYCTKTKLTSCPSAETYQDNDNYYCPGLYGSGIGGNCCIRNDGNYYSCSYVFGAGLYPGCDPDQLNTTKKCRLNGKYSKCEVTSLVSGTKCLSWSKCFY